MENLVGMVVDNDESIGALASEIRGLCIRVKWMLEAGDVEMPDAIVPEVEYDTLIFDGYSGYMGFTLSQLEDRCQSGGYVPTEISAIVQFIKCEELPKQFTSSDSPRMFLKRGDVIFVEVGDLSGSILAQVLDELVTFSFESTGKYVSNIPVRVYTGRQICVRIYLSSSNFQYTGVRLNPCAVSDEYFFSNITFVRRIQADIVYSSLIPCRLQRDEPMGYSQSGGLTDCGLKKISHYLSNIKTGVHTFTVDTSSNGDSSELNLKYPQVIMNCLIVIGHWIRYDLKYVGNGTDDSEFAKKCGVVAYSNINGFASMPRDPITGRPQYGNMFSLENCINDWMYLWFQLVRKNNARIGEFKAEIEQLVSFNRSIQSGECDGVISDLLEYFIRGAKSYITREHAFQFFSSSFNMAIQKTTQLVYGKDISIVTIEDILTEKVGDYDMNIDSLRALIFSLDHAGDADVKLILTSLRTNSYEIKHMSCLKKNDFILIDNSVVASVDVLSFVDPFLSAYNELDGDIPWRAGVDIARRVESQFNRSFQDNIDYMTNRMRTVLVLLPDDKGAVGFSKPADPPTLRFYRDSRYFSVLSIQLTYAVHARFEPDHTNRFQTTLDFTRIKLIGCKGREISHSPVDIFDDSGAIRFCCGICHQEEFSSAWMHSGLCCHIYHEHCVPAGHDRARCPICRRPTYAQRKGAAVSL